MEAAVLGAGAEGRRLAELLALARIDVRFHGSDAGTVMDSIDRIERHLDDLVSDGAITPEEREAATDRLEATTGLESAVANTQVVLDTITADGDPQARLAEIESLTDEGTLIATTATESAVTAIAAGLRHPGRAVGIAVHGEQPVVEVITTEQTTREGLERALAVTDRFAEETVVVGDAPGTVLDRLTLAVELEAMHLLSAGTADVGAIDTVMDRTWGIKPLERVDRAGLDNRLATLETLFGALGERYQPPQLLRDRVAAGKTGADAGEGFYRWERGKPVGSAVEGDASDPAPKESGE